MPTFYDRHTLSALHQRYFFIFKISGIVLMILLLISVLSLPFPEYFLVMQQKHILATGLNIAIMVLLSALFLVYSLDNSPPDSTEIIFFHLILMTFLALYFEIIVWYTPLLQGHPRLAFLCATLSYFIAPFVCLLFWFYHISIGVLKTKLHQLLSYLVVLLMFVDIYRILTSSFSGHLFRLNEVGLPYSIHEEIAYNYPIFVTTSSLIFCLLKKLPIQKKFSLLLGALSPLVGIVLSANTYMPFTYPCFSCFLLLAYGTIQIERSIELIQHKQQIAEQNRELIESQTQIMLSQIQPHFIYNTLTAIHYLCDTDPAEAKNTIEHFALYLRGNMSSLQDTQLIPFEKELEHIKTYIWIEQKRFGDALTVYYDIRCTDFSLPALTLQPLVENAVQHGLINAEDDGIIHISTRQEDKSIIITIEDNGTGFEPSSGLEDERIHIGMENVRQRLMLQCGATLTVESSLGVGTTATVILPLNEEV